MTQQNDDILKVDDRVVSSVELSEELKNTPEQQFFKTGLGFTDKLIGGFAEGDLVVLGGTPKAGKTSMLQTWTKRFGEQGVPCMWFSIELSYRELFSRFGKTLPVFYVPRVMPGATTHEWIEKKILEAKEKHGVKVVFLDHIGMVVDESVARHQNNIDILDERIKRLKRFALKERVCIIAVATLQQSRLKSKTAGFSSGDFRGTAMISYYADSLLAIDRLQGKTHVETVNDNLEVELLEDNLLIPSDAYLYVIESRRTGVRKSRIRMVMDENGDLVEA